MTLTVNERNTNSVRQALELMTTEIKAQQIRIDGLVSTMASMFARLSEIERVVQGVRLGATGHGPSVR